MKTRRTCQRRNGEKGIAFVMALIFVALFSALSIAMFNMSGTNVRVARNFHQANLARSAAESGLEFVRYWLDQVTIVGHIPEDARYSHLITALQDSDLQTHLGQKMFLDGSTLRLGTADAPILLNQVRQQFFWAEIEPEGNNGTVVRVYGQADNFDRTIETRFTYGVRQDSVFDYGVATKGPLVLSGNTLLGYVNISVESDVYIESEFYDEGLYIGGKSVIAGDVKITNPDAYVTIQGNSAGIGGETGEAAHDHVEIGAPKTDFPYPDTSHFEQYVNGVTIDSSNVGDYLDSSATLNNVRIAPNTNPKFNAGMQINGVLFIESPNVVEFGGNCDITGLVVAEGDMTDHSGSNQLIFRGDVNSASVEALPNDPQFEGLHAEKNTFVMAPGFAVSFGGSFDTLNGCIAANGVEFFGNAGGIIGGSVINYSPTIMELQGNSDLIFNRTGITDIPAGFIPELVVHFDPSSYSEIY